MVCMGSFPLILTPIKLLLVIGIHGVDFFFQFKFYEEIGKKENGGYHYK